MYHRQESLPFPSIALPQSFVYDVQKTVLTALLFCGFCRLKNCLPDIFGAFSFLPSLTIHLVFEHKTVNADIRAHVVMCKWVPSTDASML